MRRLILAVLVLTLPTTAASAADARSRAGEWCGTHRDGARDAVWSHREQDQRRVGRAGAAATTASFDVGQIAVLLDEGDLALLHNVMDLQQAALRFSPAGAGYSVSRLALPLEPDTG